jgi:hypothetical protein
MRFFLMLIKIIRRLNIDKLLKAVRVRSLQVLDLLQWGWRPENAGFSRRAVEPPRGFTFEMEKPPFRVERGLL